MIHVRNSKNHRLVQLSDFQSLQNLMMQFLSIFITSNKIYFAYMLLTNLHDIVKFLFLDRNFRCFPVKYCYNGGEFVGEDFIELCEIFNIKVSTTASYSPWSNRTYERHNICYIKYIT